MGYLKKLKSKTREKKNYEKNVGGNGINHEQCGCKGKLNQ